MVLKVKSCKIHDIVFRKKLTSSAGVWEWYPLLRIKLSYQKGRKIWVKNVIIYPCDVIRYERKTAAVLEEMARDRVVLGYSQKDMADKYFWKYGFSLSCVKRSLKKVPVAFGRLLACGLVRDSFTVCTWLKVESRDFWQLGFLYWQHTFSLSPPFSGLFS
jgi:hypothetical protein